MVFTDQPLLQLETEIVECRRCSRLVEYRERVARTRKKEFLDSDYWGRPVPGFGDPEAELMIVGLAPAAHGGNRTGRVFTGDRSGDFLVKVLNRAGFANQPVSRDRHDGLILHGAYVTAAVKCAPPDNKPTSRETTNCSPYLSREVEGLRNLRVVLCLGEFAFRSVVNVFRSIYPLGVVSEKFRHGLELKLGDDVPRIFASYHPSPRNTQTGKLTEKMLLLLLRRVRRVVEAQQSSV